MFTPTRRDWLEHAKFIQRQEARRRDELARSVALDAEAWKTHEAVRERRLKQDQQDLLEELAVLVRCET